MGIFARIYPYYLYFIWLFLITVQKLSHANPQNGEKNRKNAFLDTTAEKTLGRTYEASGQFVDKMSQLVSWTSCTGNTVQKITNIRLSLNEIRWKVKFLEKLFWPKKIPKLTFSGVKFFLTQNMFVGSEVSDYQNVCLSEISIFQKMLDYRRVGPFGVLDYRREPGILRYIH